MKILNFGSMNIDYTYKVEHIVTPGETISSNGIESVSGWERIESVRCACEGESRSLSCRYDRKRWTVFKGGL